LYLRNIYLSICWIINCFTKLIVRKSSLMWHTPSKTPKRSRFKLRGGQSLNSHIFSYHLFCNIYFPPVIRCFSNKLDQNCGALDCRIVTCLIILSYFPFLVSLLLRVYSVLLIYTAMRRILCLYTEWVFNFL